MPPEVFVDRFIPPDLEHLDPHQERLVASLRDGARAASPANGLLLADGHLGGPFGPLLALGEAGTALAAAGEALRFRGRLPDRARELCILLVAARTGSTFEWWTHARIARDLGVGDDALQRLAEGRATGWDGVEGAALEGAAALLARSTLDDAEFARLRAVLSQKQLIEVAAVVGYYTTLALLMNALGVGAPSEPVGSLWSGS